MGTEGRVGRTFESAGEAEKHLDTVARTGETIEVDLMDLVAALSSLQEVRCMMVVLWVILRAGLRSLRSAATRRCGDIPRRSAETLRAGNTQATRG